MRNAFLATLLELAADDRRITLVVGDVGYSVVEAFAERFPDRFVNAGVAEQAMTGIAAGMALAGLRPFTYSIANFPTLRCLEQIRNDICHHRADVVVVAVGAGFAYGALGYSHHAVQDIACLRTLPHLMLATPADRWETRAVVRRLVGMGGPAYLRLGKGGDPVIHAAEPEIVPGRPLRLLDGGPDAVLACGGVAVAALAAARPLGAAAYSLPLWRADPATREAIAGLVAGHRRVVVVEEHVAAGGVGAFVRECLEGHPELQQRVRCLAADASVLDEVGPADVLRQRAGLDAAAIGRALTR